jgi:hypothetical protein
MQLEGLSIQTMVPVTGCVLLATFMHCFYSFVFLRAEQIEDARQSASRQFF